MIDDDYKCIEVTGSSVRGEKRAIQEALSDAFTRVRNIRWFTVLDAWRDTEEHAAGIYRVRVEIGYIEHLSLSEPKKLSPDPS